MIIVEIVIEVLVYRDFTFLKEKIGKDKIYTNFTVNFCFCRLLCYDN